MSKQSSCAIIVTYNRKQDLVACIKNLLLQTTPLDEIIVIDNASTDGTLDYLVAEEIVTGGLNPFPLTTKHGVTTLVYSNTGENIGGAGGFNCGQKMAVERGHYYLWMMDDDALPEAKCFQLLKDLVDQNVVDIVNPLVVNVENKDVLSFGLSKEIQTVSQAKGAANNDVVLYGLANPFNGTLFTKDIIQDIGFIKSEMFIWGDEVEYMSRASSKGYRYGTSYEAVIYHPPSKTEYDSCLFGFVKMVSKPKKLEMNYYRNQGYLSRINRFGFKKLNFFFRGVLYFSLKLEPRRLVKFSAYFFDGFFDLYKLPSLSKR